jgi:hypothetical protein
MTLKRRFREHVEASQHACAHCGRPADFFGPDPYQSEINNDQTKMWLCDECAGQSALDV